MDAITLGKISAIRQYPSLYWDLKDPHNWTLWNNLCNGLHDYLHKQLAPKVVFKSINPQRKWEIVSTYQKAVRRGETALAQRMIGAFMHMPAEWGYLWRRVCVTAAEDVGPAVEQGMLMAFVVLTSTFFRPNNTTTSDMYDTLCYLTELMGDAAERSRYYCSLSLIDETTGFVPSWRVEKLLGLKKTMPTPEPFNQWMLKNSPLTEGLMSYAVLGLSDPITINPSMPEVRTLRGLPAYAYDMHTRTGIIAINMLKENPYIQEILHSLQPKEPGKALGFCIFYLEGGRILNEKLNAEVALEEQKAIAYRFGLTLDNFQRLRYRVYTAIENGQLDICREKALQIAYGD